MIPITPKKGFEINENTEASCEKIKIGWGAIKQADNYLMVIRNSTSIITSCACAEGLCHPLWAGGSFLGKGLGSEAQSVGKGMAWLISINAWEGRTVEERKGQREERREEKLVQDREGRGRVAERGETHRERIP